MSGGGGDDCQRGSEGLKEALALREIKTREVGCLRLGTWTVLYIKSIGGISCFGGHLMVRIFFFFSSLLFQFF